MSTKKLECRCTDCWCETIEECKLQPEHDCCSTERGNG